MNLELKGREKEMKNKKGQSFGFMIGFFVLVAVILALGFMIAIGSSVFNLAADEIVPIFNELGMVETTNMTQASGYVITPVNSLIQNFTWIGGVMFVVALFGLIGLSFGYRITFSKWYLGFFLIFAVLIIILSMVFSNIYQDFYEGTDEIATRMQEQQILSWFMLYSPMIFGVVIFISGVIMFSGVAQEDFV